MKRISTIVLAGVLAGTASAGLAGRAARAASQPSKASSSQHSYAVTMLVPPGALSMSNNSSGSGSGNSGSSGAASGQTVLGTALLMTNSGGSRSSNSGSGNGSSGSSSAMSGTITGAITLDGLKPNTTYTITLQPAPCSPNSGNSNSASTNGYNGHKRSNLSAHTLTQVKANGMGAANASLKFAVSKLPTGSLADTVAVYQRSGPNGNSASGKSGSSGKSSPSGNVAVSCGQLRQPKMVSPLKAVGGGNASGEALITEPAMVLTRNQNNKPTLVKGTQVIIYATGLQKVMAQPDHIHLGQCGSDGPILFPLTTLTPDSSGSAVGGTVIPALIPTSGVSVEIHRANFKVEACGNLTGSAAR